MFKQINYYYHIIIYLFHYLFFDLSWGFLFFVLFLHVHEVLSMLEDVGEFEEASIYIEPSPVAAITDEDSADEDEGGTYSNLN